MRAALTVLAFVCLMPLTWVVAVTWASESLRRLAVLGGAIAFAVACYGAFALGYLGAKAIGSAS